MESLNRFNWIAGSYDFLVKIVFGEKIKIAQLQFLKDIPEASNILILGGGTGWLLAEIIRIHPNSNVWYIEASSSMIKITKRKLREYLDAKICFIHGTEESIPTGLKFNVVISNFYFDMFSDLKLLGVINNIKKILLPKGIWLSADFIDTGRTSHKLLLKLMYAFFRITSGIESRKLPQWEALLKKAGMEELKSKAFYNSFIKSVEYVKTN